MLKKYLLLLNLALFSVVTHAQSYQPLNIDGFNEDVIANGIGSPTATTSADVDGVNYSFCEIGWQSSSSATGTSSGLPVGGLIVSDANSDLEFQLQDYDDDNSIRLSSTLSEITSNVDDDGETFTKLYVLMTSGSGDSNINIEVSFTDNTTQSFTSIVPDWYNQTSLPVAASGFGRVNLTNGNFETAFQNPRLYQLEMALDTDNHTKTIESITFTRAASSGGIINIFAVSGITLGDCPNPTDVEIDNIDTNTADVTVNEPAILPLEYEYEVRTGGTPGNDDDDLIISDFIDSDDTTLNLINLPASTDLYLYVRSVCDDENPWEGPFEFTTLCDIFEDFYEGFDSSTNMPNCWGALNNTFGFVDISSTNYSSPNGLRMYNSFSSSGDLVAFGPRTDELGNGNYRIRFRANGSGTLKVITSANQESLADTVELETITLSGSWQTYIVELPAGTHDYFAFQHGFSGMYQYIYIDDVYYEEIPSCTTPTDFSVSNITIDSALFSWEEPSTLVSEGYEIEIRTSGVPGDSDGLFYTEIVDAADTSVEIDGLNNSTNYTAYIRSLCAVDDDSMWSDDLPFQTIAVTPSPWIEAFSTNYETPFGWTHDGTVSNITQLNDGGSSNYIYRNIYSFAPELNAASINVGPILEGDVFTFKYNLVNYSWMAPYNPAPSNSGDIKVEISTDFGETYTEIETFINNGNAGWQEFTYDLEDYEDEYVKIKVTATAFSGSDYYVGFDDFTISNDNACFTPNNIALEDIGLFSATVSWQNTYVENADAFEYELRTSGNAGSGNDGLVQTDTTDDGDTLEVDFSNLDALTTYSFYIRSICSDTSNSEWTAAFTFTTQYCTPSYNNSSSNHRILTVGIDELSFTDNIPSVSSTDRTDIEVPDFTVGETYTFNVQTSGWIAIGAAIDYNMDGDFDDDDEIIALPIYEASDIQTYIFTHTIPADAYSGEYRLRIWNRLANAGGSPDDDPCGSYNYGTFVDYQITITGNDLVCANPTDLEAINIESYNVDIVWSEDEDSTVTYQIEYGEVNFTQGEGTLTTTASNALFIDGLEANTTYEVYVKKMCSMNEESNWVSITFTTACDIEAPAAILPVHSCEILNVQDIEITVNEGETVRWYASETSNAILTSINQTGTYYVSAFEDACESERTPIEITIVLLLISDAVSTQEFCGDAQISDLIVNNAADYQVHWYDSVASTTPLASGTHLDSGTYYVTLSDDICETDKIAIQVNIFSVPNAITEQNFAVCGFATLADFSFETPEVATINWYANATNQSPLDNSTQVQSGTLYVSVEQNNCESERTPIHFVMYSGLPMPSASSQSFCNFATVADLVADDLTEGATLHWYDSATAEQSLTPDTPLNNGTYYVSQKNDTCESTRKAISVWIIQLSDPILNPILVCDGAVIDDVHLPITTDVEYVWYSNPTTTTPLSPETILTNTVYYISKTLNGCESGRTAVDVVVNPIPNAPTGDAEQSFIYDVPSDATIADLIINEGETTWYISEEDAINQENPLDANTPLVNGLTYYTVIVSEFGCVSEVFSTTVTLTLGAVQFDKSKLVYYPNPTTGKVNIQYVDNIEQVIVYNAIGQKVSTHLFNSNHIQFDMSELSQGIYLLKLHAGKQQQLIKIVKK